MEFEMKYLKKELPSFLLLLCGKNSNRWRKKRRENVARNKNKKIMMRYVFL